jgi:hypothetical protein
LITSRNFTSAALIIIIHRALFQWWFWKIVNAKVTIPCTFANVAIRAVIWIYSRNTLNRCYQDNLMVNFTLAQVERQLFSPFATPPQCLQRIQMAVIKAEILGCARNVPLAESKIDL